MKVVGVINLGVRGEEDDKLFILIIHKELFILIYRICFEQTIIYHFYRTILPPKSIHAWFSELSSCRVRISMHSRDEIL